jgi:hypothetical protein
MAVMGVLWGFFRPKVKSVSGILCKYIHITAWLANRNAREAIHWLESYRKDQIVISNLYALSLKIHHTSPISIVNVSMHLSKAYNPLV